jgi:hypothetical protein
LILSICLSPQRCGPWLAAKIIAGHIRWRAKTLAGELVEDSWRADDLARSINFEDCTATWLALAPATGPTGFYCVTLYGLELAREDIEAQGVAAKLSPQLKGAKLYAFESATRLPHRDDEEMLEYVRRLQRDDREAHPWLRETKPKNIAARLYELGMGPRQKRD